MATQTFSGSVEAFDQNWRKRHESVRYHFHRGAPQNQIQFAFQSHWRVFRQLLGARQSGRVLEVGCGRGSMGAFFADAGFEVHLLDTSHAVLEIARANFALDGLPGLPIGGNALALPYPDATFDVVVSIGLFEHFRDLEAPLYEQLRVLAPGGLFLGYVVPERPLSVQTLALPLNALLRLGHGASRLLHVRPHPHASRGAPKSRLYRNTCTAADYLALLHRAGVQQCGSFGMFPVPLISHSPSFPFSLMSPPLERLLVQVWQRVLTPGTATGQDPWTCPEWWGLAFLVWAIT